MEFLREYFASDFVYVVLSQMAAAVAAAWLFSTMMIGMVASCNWAIDEGMPNYGKTMKGRQPLIGSETTSARAPKVNVGRCLSTA